MGALRFWQERIRRSRESPRGELLFMFAGHIPGYTLVHAIAGTLTWPAIAGFVIGVSISAPLGLLWYRSRGTTKPLLLLPVVVEVTLLAALILVLHLLLDLSPWQTLLLASVFAAYEAVHRHTMPRTWTEAEEHDVSGFSPVSPRDDGEVGQ